MSIPSIAPWVYRVLALRPGYRIDNIRDHYIPYISYLSDSQALVG